MVEGHVDIFHPCGFKSCPRHQLHTTREKSRMKVLLDTKSGDAPPEEIINGAIGALQSESGRDLQVTLVGDEKFNRQHVESQESNQRNISYINAPHRISME